jgi:acyl-CoA thioesterase FadM
MKLWLRLLVQLVSWRTRKPLQIHEVAKRKFRVWPTDLDIYNHMNNGVFLTILDLGRYDHGELEFGISGKSLVGIRWW